MSSPLDRNDRRELRVGDIVGDRYEIRRELGRGAGGVVFETVHRLTGRAAALKVLSPDVPRSSIAEQSARLIREARALASVRHPGIVEVLDGGTLDDGTPFIVLERLHGRTLEGLLAARGKLSREDTIAIGIQLCEALDAMHAAGVVHRDLKPGNVFVVNDRDGAERLKLLDFGLASMPSTQSDKLTTFGAINGTPAYMSREQLLALDVDARADIYSLGVTLFECLAGRVPHEGNYPSVLLQVCAPDAKRPVLADFAPDVDPALAEVVERATDPEAERRFATALEFGRALLATLPSARTTTFFLGPARRPRLVPLAASEATPDQRRVARRAPYNAPVQLTTEGRSIDGHSEDISERGLLLICRSPCETGSHATVRFALPIEGKVGECQVIVRWVRAARPHQPEGPRAIGLEFVDLPETVRASIAQYITLMGV